jgi:hypothetical protein
MPGTERLLWMSLVCSGLAAAACASTPAPGATVQLAQDAVARAQQGHVATHAPLPLRQAQEKLQAAKAAIRGRQNVEARRLAEQATVDAERAIATAAREETKQTVAELSATVDALQGEVQR